MPREDMCQVDLPNPVQEDIQKLQQANAVLTNRLLDLENEMRLLRRKRETEEQKGPNIEAENTK